MVVSAAHPFVGRRRELATLTAAVDAGSSGRGSVWFVRGEPGVGKTRLALEALDHAREHGALAALSTSWDLGGAPAYWPWIELFRSLARDDRHPRPLPDLSVGGHTGDRDRFAMFDEVRRHLRDAAADRPLVLVLDDLHAADLSTLLLLRFVAGAVHDTAITIIGTYRPVDMALRGDPSDPTADEAVAHLEAAARCGGNIDLVGLSPDEVDELVRRQLDPGTSPALVRKLVARVIERSGGNPLFVQHFASLVIERLDAGALGDADLDDDARADVEVPDSIRRLFAGRLDRLDPATRRALRVAAVLGASFDPLLVGELVDDAHLAERLVGTTSLDLVQPDDASGSDAASATSWSFGHPVLREVLLDELAPVEREHWHGEVYRALVERGTTAASPDRLAHHLVLAGAGRAVEAAESCETAALAAVGAAAFEDAVGHFRTGLRSLDRAGADPATDGLRLRLLIGLGRTMWRASQRVGGDEVFDEAWRIAVELDDVEGMVAAALGGGFSKAFTKTYPNEAVRRCEVALQRLPEGPSVERGLLCTKLASELVAHPDQSLARAAALEALEVARCVDDPRCTGEALAGVLVTDLGPDRLDERVAMADEMLDIAARTGDLAIAVQARFQLVGALVQLGDRGRLDAVIDAQRREVDELAEPGYLRHAVWFQVMVATVDGDAGRAERLADDGLAAASLAADPDGPIVWGGQVGVVRWLQGRVDELEPLYRDMAATSAEPVWTTILAWLWSRNGMLAAARGLLDRLGPAGVAAIPRDRHWLLALVTTAEAAARTGHEEIGGVAEQLLTPYRDQQVPIAMGISYWGTVARPLGLLALAGGRRAEGIAHLERAVEVTARFGAAPWMVEAQLDLAEALLDDVGDSAAHVRAASLLDDAATVGERLDLVESRERVAASRARLSALAPPNALGPERPLGPDVEAGAAPSITSRPRVHVSGGFVCLDVDGAEVQWSSRKARSLLKLLVAARNGRLSRESLIDRLWPGEPHRSVANRLAVAVATVRRALDPDRRFDRQAFVGSDRHTVWIVDDAVDVDLWRFLDLATEALSTGSVESLRLAAAAYGGPPFTDDPADEWWFTAREQARGRMVDVCRALASSARRRGDRRAEADALRELLVADPYDETGHQALIDLHRATGAHGLAELAEARRRTVLTGS